MVTLVAAGSLVIATAACQTAEPEPAPRDQAEQPATDYGPMIARFETLRRQDPNDFNALIGLARYLRYDGRVDEAIPLLEAERERFGDQPRYLTELGAAYLTVGEVSKAEALLDRSLELDPDYWHTHATLAIVYDRRGTPGKAVAANTKALEFCPESASIQNNMGLSLGAAGEVDQAISYLAAAHGTQPDSVIIKNNLDFFREIKASGEDYSAADHQELTATLHANDWPVGRGVTCSGDLIESEEIAQTLGEQSFIDLMIHFEFDSAVLRPDAEEALDELAQAMMTDELRAEDFLIEGHTDAVGTGDYNQGLSERRAAAAQRYLVARGGIEGSRLSSVGYGERRLLDPERPDDGINRRVRIVRQDG